jgi:hypothetical protein
VTAHHARPRAAPASASGEFVHDADMAVCMPVVTIAIQVS